MSIKKKLKTGRRGVGKGPKRRHSVLREMAARPQGTPSGQKKGRKKTRRRMKNRERGGVNAGELQREPGKKGRKAGPRDARSTFWEAYGRKRDAPRRFGMDLTQ